MFDSTKICGSKSNGTERLKNFGRLEKVLFAGYLKISFFPKVAEDILRKTEETKEVNKQTKLEIKTHLKNILCFPVSATEKTRNGSEAFLFYWCFQP